MQSVCIAAGTGAPAAVAWRVAQRARAGGIAVVHVRRRQRGVVELARRRASDGALVVIVYVY